MASIQDVRQGLEKLKGFERLEVTSREARYVAAKDEAKYHSEREAATVQEDSARKLREAATVQEDSARKLREAATVQADSARKLREAASVQEDSARASKIEAFDEVKKQIQQVTPVSGQVKAMEEALEAINDAALIKDLTDLKKLPTATPGPVAKEVPLPKVNTPAENHAASGGINSATPPATEHIMAEINQQKVNEGNQATDHVHDLTDTQQNSDKVNEAAGDGENDRSKDANHGNSDDFKAFKEAVVHHIDEAEDTDEDEEGVEDIQRKVDEHEAVATAKPNTSLFVEFLRQMEFSEFWVELNEQDERAIFNLGAASYDIGQVVNERNATFKYIGPSDQCASFVGLMADPSEQASPQSHDIFNYEVAEIDGNVGGTQFSAVSTPKAIAPEQLFNGLSQVACMEHLRYLKIRNVKFLRAGTLGSLMMQLPSVQKLEIKGCVLLHPIKLLKQSIMGSITTSRGYAGRLKLDLSYEPIPLHNQVDETCKAMKDSGCEPYAAALGTLIAIPQMLGSSKMRTMISRTVHGDSSPFREVMMGSLIEEVEKQLGSKLQTEDIERLEQSYDIFLQGYSFILPMEDFKKKAIDSDFDQTTLDPMQALLDNGGGFEPDEKIHVHYTKVMDDLREARQQYERYISEVENERELATKAKRQPLPITPVSEYHEDDERPLEVAMKIVLQPFMNDLAEMRGLTAEGTRVNVAACSETPEHGVLPGECFSHAEWKRVEQQSAACKMCFLDDAIDAYVRTFTDVHFLDRVLHHFCGDDEDPFKSDNVQAWKQDPSSRPLRLTPCRLNEEDERWATTAGREGSKMASVDDLPILVSKQLAIQLKLTISETTANDWDPSSGGWAKVTGAKKTVFPLSGEDVGPVKPQVPKPKYDLDTRPGTVMKKRVPPSKMVDSSGEKSSTAAAASPTDVAVQASTPPKKLNVDTTEPPKESDVDNMGPVKTPTPAIAPQPTSPESKPPSPKAARSSDQSVSPKTVKLVKKKPVTRDRTDAERAQLMARDDARAQKELQLARDIGSYVSLTNARKRALAGIMATEGVGEASEDSKKAGTPEQKLKVCPTELRGRVCPRGPACIYRHMCTKARCTGPIDGCSDVHGQKIICEKYFDPDEDCAELMCAMSHEQKDWEHGRKADLHEQGYDLQS